MSAMARLLERVKKAASGCWEWQGAIDSSGHGTMKDGDRQRATHVIAFESKHGPCPAGKMVCHKCHNKRCCNPAHLYAGSASDNAKDREAAKHSTSRVLHASDGFEAVGGDGKKWSQLFPWGKRYRQDYPGGSISYDGAFFATLLENWEASGRQPLPIDYFHRGHSIDGDGNTTEDKVAAGWIHDVEVRQGQGAWALIEWTVKGAEKVKAGELRYLSPTFELNWLNPKTGKKAGPRLMAAGLLNDPFFTDMPRVAASAKAAPPPAKPKEKPMEKKLLCAALNLPEDTDDDTLNATLTKCGAWLKAPDEEVKKQTAATAEALTASQRETAVLKQAVETVQKQNAELTTTLQQMAAAKKAADVEAVVEAHSKHFAPANRPLALKLVQTMGVEEGAKMLASWPVVAPPMGTVGMGGEGPGTGDKVANGATLESIATGLQKSEGLSATAAFLAAAKRNPHLL